MNTQTHQRVESIPLRDHLFGDLPLNYWGNVNHHDSPWSVFTAANQFDEDGEDAAAIKTLQQVLALPGLESRHYLQAHHLLRKLYSVRADSNHLYGVVLEISMEEGHDLLAVYEDHSARYYNFAGNAIVLDPANDIIAKQIDSILALGKSMVPNIGAWKYDRPEAPAKGMARLNLLTADGLHFGEGQQAALFNDPMAGKIMFALLTLLETMTNLATSKQ